MLLQAERAHLLQSMFGELGQVFDRIFNANSASSRHSTDSLARLAREISMEASSHQRGEEKAFVPPDEIIEHRSIFQVRKIERFIVWAAGKSRKIGQSQDKENLRLWKVGHDL